LNLKSKKHHNYRASPLLIPVQPQQKKLESICWKYLFRHHQFHINRLCCMRWHEYTVLIRLLTGKFFYTNASHHIHGQKCWNDLIITSFEILTNTFLLLLSAFRGWSSNIFFIFYLS
jgi:hypothetical protein